jgi:hypothetical protein
MEKIVLGDKLFHAIKPNISWFCLDDYQKSYYDVMREKIGSIFNDKLIMCRRDLYSDPKKPYYPSDRNLNGDDCVSLSRDISNQDNDESYGGHVIKAGEENGWIDYPFNYPAFVFNKKLLEKNSEYKGVRIPLEIQVKKSIALEDAIAISVPASYLLTPFFENDIEIGKALSYYECEKYKYMMLRYLLTLTKEHQMNLPIVDILSGTIYHENQKYEEAINKIK